ncbi:hypothetical protein TNCV_1314341 [Trichonephila clavipes]|nr:hypothetical protein TNCV_1314341 [Trichonephila clavipes]
MKKTVDFKMLLLRRDCDFLQEESDSVDDKMEEEENNNNESSKDLSNVDAFSALETAMEVVSPSIASSGNSRRAKSYCHLYGAQGQRQAQLQPPCHDEFRGPRSDYVRKVALEQQQI